MSDRTFYAHSKEGCPIEEWQPLEDHLSGVAEKAAEFAGAFGAEEWGRVAGWLHDLGKGTLSWQAYLQQINGVLEEELSRFFRGRVEHAIVGAREAFQNLEKPGQLLAYCLAGHHGGMPNWQDDPDTALKSRLAEEGVEIQYQASVPAFPERLPFEPDRKRFLYQLQFFVRMLFSCLVDADYLDTEKALDPEKAEWRSEQPSFEKMSEQFQERFDALRESADPSLNVNLQRERVLLDCLGKADLPHGIFSLTVPTGGGKTLASLAFALAHARAKGQRIIYVIPFTSIIEQNADVFRKMLGDDAVLEHHCNFVPDETDCRSKLLSENWNAPVVVTTNVQFFDSFYSNKPSRCRKLHNVANSIVIFDEVQAIPVEKLKPCLEVIRELSFNYGVTSVLCTATQPTLEENEYFTDGLTGVTEIIGDVPSLFSALKRTQEHYIGEVSEKGLASRLQMCEQVLCVVNTRQHALDIYAAMEQSPGNLHLSALMHPAHRRRKLEEIRYRLRHGLPCRVVSTQLIEAGVDVDFPVVYREATGIDSIAQAAGRCNRNGLLDMADVFVFSLAGGTACSAFRQATQSASKLFKRFAGSLTCPECVRTYFEDYFWKNQQRMDEGGIVDLCNDTRPGQFQFREIAAFRMIETATVPIVVALEEEAVELVGALRVAEHKGRILRRLQQYTVQVYPYQFEELASWCEMVDPGIWVLSQSEVYSDTTGLKCSPPEGGAFFG